MSTPHPPQASQEAPEGFAITHPLDEFYAEMGQALPPLQQVDAGTVPQPYKQLLVHHDDMTPTLEKFYQQDIHLRVLSRRQRGDEYFREVALLLDSNDQPVEFGAIKIWLHLFSPEARKQILAERRPLGHILQEQGMQHSSRPKAYLRLASDRVINEALSLTGAHVLYGRRNTLFDPKGRALAEIVEILPPKREGGKA